MLMKFQKQRIIQTEESEWAEDNFNFQELLESKSPGVRLQALSKVV